MKYKLALVVLLQLLLAACANQNARILEGGNQLELRSMQSRAFDTNDKNMVVRTVIATMQDLSFVIDKADADLGTVSGTKLGGYQIKMTVTVRPKSESQTLVRANAQYNLNAIEDPEVYQSFFTSLQKAMFLTAHSIE
ncbi:MAG: hypothetical protein ACMV0I_04030 [Pseudomonas sp.]